MLKLLINFLWRGDIVHNYNFGNIFTRMNSLIDVFYDFEKENWVDGVDQGCSNNTGCAKSLTRSDLVLRVLRPSSIEHPWYRYGRSSQETLAGIVPTFTYQYNGRYKNCNKYMVMKDNIAYSGIVNIRAKELYPKWNGSSNLVKYFFESTNLLHWRRPCVCTDRDEKIQVYLEIGKSYSEAVLSCRRITNFEECFTFCSRNHL